MKKTNKKLISIILIISMIIGYVVPIHAAEATTKDYSEMLKTLSTEYSYGALIWGDETTVSVIEGNTAKYVKDFGVGEDKKEYEVGALANQVIKLKITKCAMDKDGDLCDAICTVDNIQLSNIPPAEDEIGKGKFPDFEDGDIVRTRIDIGRYGHYEDPNIPEGEGINLIKIWFSTRGARNDFSMQYVKSGTNTPANITKVTSTIGDIDADYSRDGDLYDGNEAIMVDGATSQIYYEKNNLLVDTENDYGVRIEKHRDNINYLEKRTSAVILQDLSNATYKLSYSGRNCGIFYVFASPQTFELPKPTKTTNKKTVYEGEDFKYTIRQYVPNNYFADELNFVSGTNGKYKSFVIEDQIDSNVEIKSGIKIVNELKKDVTSYFDISTENNKVTATLKSANLNNYDFYGHFYSMTIPVVAKEGAGKNIDEISNIAITKTTNNNDPETEQSTPPTITNLKYKVDVTAVIDNGTTKIDNGEAKKETTMPTKEAKHGDNVETVVTFTPTTGYEVVSVTLDGKQVTATNNKITIPDNNIDHNIQHNVVVNTQKKPAQVTTRYVDEDGNKLLDPIVNNDLKVGDKYTTEQKTIPKYEFKEVQGNPTGTATEKPITVTYVYRLKDTTVKAIYVDEQDNPLADAEEKTYKVDAPYTTEAKTIPGYKLTTTPTNAKGTTTEEPITVKYVYTKKDTSVTVNYLDEEDNKSLSESETMTGKVNDPYTTEPKDIPNYVLVEEKLPTNANGNMQEDPIVVNYYYRVKDAKVIVKHVDKDGKNLVDPETVNKKYNDPYDTSSKDIPNYKLVGTPENASGTVDKDVIEVTYVYDLKPAQVIVNHLDENGKKIADSDTVDGKVTEKYTTKEKQIKGYTLTKVPQNAEGTMTEKTIVVNYIYAKNETPKVTQLPKTGNSDKYIIAIATISVFAIAMAIAKNKYKEI